MEQPLPRKLVAEFLGSLLLAAALVIGSGIAAQRLSPGDTGLQLTENAAATAAGLFALILMFGPISGAHFNPKAAARASAAASVCAHRCRVVTVLAPRLSLIVQTRTCGTVSGLIRAAIVAWKRGHSAMSS